jgi:hypothetical protein
MNQFSHIARLAFVLSCLIMLTGCPAPVNPPAGPTDYTITDYTSLGSSRTITFDNLGEGDRLLVIPLNTVTSKSSVTNPPPFAMTMDVAYTGGTPAGVGPLHEKGLPPSLDDSLEPGLRDMAIESDLPYPPSNEWRANKGASRTVLTVGTAASFWVIQDMAAGTAVYVSVPATLMYEATRCHVFMSDTIKGNAKAVTIATQMGQAFDSSIYARATSVFGHEWGGVPADNGGIDGDTKIFVFIQDQTANCGGYFSSADEYSDASVQPTRRSNEKEIVNIVLSGSQMDQSLIPLDTLAHEFQHMIDFNEHYRTGGSYQWPIINEGFSQTCETLCGYGPEITRLAYLQSKPAVSYTAWHFTALPYDVIYAYSAGYALMEYAVRRFGSSFTNAVYRNVTVGVAGVEAALSGVGYTSGYRGLVLDMLTAHYLDRDRYSYPSAGLFTGDTGIDLDSTTSRWYAYGPSTRSGLLRGLSTNFCNTYPQSFNIQLYEYGADAYEFASGASGTITLSLSNIQPNNVLRVVHLKSAGRPAMDIDGRLGDWATKTVDSKTDPLNDNDLTSGGVATGIFGLTGADINRYQAFIENNVLYVSIETQTAPIITDADGYFMIKVDVTGDTAFDYNLYFYDDELLVYTVSPFARVDLITAGARYGADNAVEIAIPLSMFTDTLKNPIVVRPYAISLVSGVSKYDFVTQYLNLSW